MLITSVTNSILLTISSDRIPGVHKAVPRRRLVVAIIPALRVFAQTFRRFSSVLRGGERQVDGLRLLTARPTTPLEAISVD
jgi:hypothetical protein